MAWRHEEAIAAERIRSGAADHKEDGAEALDKLGILALGGETPRGVAMGERREDVLRLVRGIENQADRSRRRGEPGVDVGWLRAELAIDEDLAA